MPELIGVKNCPTSKEAGMNKVYAMAGLGALLLAAPVWAGDPETFDPRSASLEELDRRCEAAREAKIAPLREAEIAKCKADKRNDPAYCERFWADYGESTKTPKGRYIPRKFHDLPECKVAERERKRRARE